MFPFLKSPLTVASGHATAFAIKKKKSLSLFFSPPPCSPDPSLTRLYSFKMLYKKGFCFRLFSVSKAKILGNPELYIKSGSDINLTCVVLQTPEPPSFIYWYQGGHVVNYSQRGGINVVTEKQTRTSRLLIARALPADSGNYTCAPSSSDSASVIVHVLNGKYLCLIIQNVISLILG